MSIRRVAIIFDNTVRPDTTGVYCRRALGRLVEVEHFLPTDLDRLSREKFDLYLAIDDGLNYQIPADLHPSAYWAIDTHLDFQRELERALSFDFVFAAQRDGAEQLRQHGIPTAQWLPLACDPDLHSKQDVAKQYDTCFVGNIFPGPREELVRLLQEKFPNSFVGRQFFAEMARTFSASRIVFNRSLRNDVNMRIFEALSTGSLLLTNDLRENGQDELFRDGLHLATYRDADELVDKIDFYLRRPELRERVAETGRKTVLAEHTYQHRMEKILEAVEGHVASRHSRPQPVSKPPQENTPGDSATAEPQSDPTRCSGLTSIILVTCGQWKYTRLCIESIQSCTPEPYELVVVDNGSTDETVDCLRVRQDIILIANSENRGFPAGANQGILAARGEQILLLNNDTVVTNGWLQRMLETLHSDRRIGLVGPSSNNVSGEQQIPVTYDRLESMDAFAQTWAQLHDCQTVNTDRLVGFCLLFRREVIEQIGLLDERFGIGNFEDDDICRRAIQAGYRAVIAVSAFVHHFGQATFLGNGVDLATLLESNRRKYCEKHFGPASPGTPPSYYVARSHSGGLLIQPGTPQLTLCMIVRDNELTIGPALESIRPHVDEIVVVDTGSKDKTLEICRQHGARLFEFPWCDDFSAARNESLRQARGGWIFWMDSDDTISPECGRQLRDLANSSHAASILAYVMQVHCPGAGRDGQFDVTVVDHVKLIRNRPDLRFEGRIHEQLLPAIRRAGGDVAWTDIHVVHSGSDHSPDGWQRKLDRDLRILHLELTERPNHPFVLFNLGMTYADAQKFDKAIGFLEQSLAVSIPEESHVRKAFALLVSTLAQSERHDDAWTACQNGLALYPDDKELLFRSAMLHHHFGRLRQAEAAYLQVLNDHEERHFSSIDHGLASYKARFNLAIVYEDMGRLAHAETQWRQIVHDVPDYSPARHGLQENLVSQGKLASTARHLNA